MQSTAMRKSKTFSAVLTLFLLVPASITWAQTITTQKGLTTAIFTTSGGTVKIYLPDDIRPGDVISGSFVLEPSGTNKKQVDRNLAELKKSHIILDGNDIDLAVSSASFHLTMSDRIQAQTSFELVCTTVDQKTSKLIIPNSGDTVIDRSLPGCSLPSHALTGSPMSITGPFDGDASNTTCRLNDRLLDILAESPRQCHVQYPQNANGLQLMQVEENGIPACTRQISGVDMQVTTGKLKLRKGESTYIDVKLTGLENLPDKALLTITNITPNVVSMVNGNLQVIPVWPPAEGAGGIFSVHCPAVSNTTGDFLVNINLDLPAPGETVSDPAGYPPGYTSKSCECHASVTITRSGNNVKAETKAECKGQYGVGINTFPSCTVASSTLEWSIQSGQGNVELAGKKDAKEITLRPLNKKGFIVCVTLTVRCIDGTVCKATDCITEPGESPPPPVNKCACRADCSISESGRQEDTIRYSGTVRAECKGTSGAGITQVACSVRQITYNWQIGDSGKDVAEISGKNDGKDVTVVRKKEGAYNLYLSGTVTCSDGTVCEFSCNTEVPAAPTTTKDCNLLPEEKMEPAMDGGLNQKYKVTDKQVRRDDFIILGAEGEDADMLKWICHPNQPYCPDTRSEKTILLNSRVRFEWNILSGEGSFVKLGCLPARQLSDAGDVVIFQPPVVPLPVKAVDTSLTTTVKLLIIDDNPTQPADATVERIITIITKRRKSVPDFYSLTVNSPAMKPLDKTLPPEVKGSCSATGPDWEALTGISPDHPVIELPGVADNDKMVLGQWLVLQTADTRDEDKVTINCISSSNCTTAPWRKVFQDAVTWQWTKNGGGDFITDASRQYIIYQAPTDLPDGKDFVDIEFKVMVKNAGGKANDRNTAEAKKKIRVYRPGVRLSHPPTDWLPADSNYVDLTSELMYKDGVWKPALAHMCRIHYAELVSVSEEKGVCLNAPVPKEADQCRDLQLMNEAGHEAFDDVKGSGKCTLKEIYQQARTKAPERNYTFRVFSRDFGSYGFLRSFANVNKKTSVDGKPIYISIPVKKADVTHPQGREKKTEYADNRVTIPLDIDENRIADGGWIAFGNVQEKDPADNKGDDDGDPAGDGFRGDGITTYEEYRGFKVSARAGIVHQRTNVEVKDIFIRNENNLPVTLYQDITDLDMHEITALQYNGDDQRYINFNFNPATHLRFEQRGLHLVDKGNHSSLLGIAYSPTGRPTIPNFEEEIRIYSVKVRSAVEKVNKGVEEKDKITYTAKLAGVVAHELLHGNNVCHHGEGDPEQASSFDKVNGLRSGNIDCVMRYDNVGTALSKIPERTGTILCTSAAGTGYNANGQRFGNAATLRGNCKEQIRISAAGGLPKSCGNR